LKEKLINILNDNNIKYDEDKLNSVILYINDIYKDKTRYTKETFYEHTFLVAIEVAKLKLDENSIYGSLLHEVVKFNVDLKDITSRFGEDVTNLIKGISRISYLNYSNHDKLDMNILRKMFMAIAKDIRVILIKLCDRLITMRNIKKVEEKIRYIKAKESMEIYSPIAHRLGISHIKSELEDISFRMLLPDEYNNIKSTIDAKKDKREEYIKNKMEEIEKVLKSNNIDAKVYGRPKHFYSIYKKMKEKNCEVDDIFDLLAIRIIVSSIKDCYSVLGLVHELYKPMPGRFKDYIAVPKTNNYQSLHTTVFGNNNIPFEVQIRTWDMQNQAEYGVAAHFMYKEKMTDISETEQKIMWIRQTLELQKELTEEVTNLNNFKGELFGEEVFVFTPKGDIKSLPKGSTIVDFAYTIHQNIAEKMTGAKVNGKIVPISTKLNNTDVVSIITSSNSSGPTLDWFKYAKTSSARNKISSYLKKQGSKDNILRGKELFEKGLKKQKIAKDELTKDIYTQELIEKLRYKDMNNLYENIGFGSISYVKVVNKLLEIYNKINHIQKINLDVKSKVKNKREDSIVVEGLTNCLVKFSKCCAPLPGDDIIGYITQSKGVSIHRKDCKNLSSLDINKRKINVKWKEQIKSKYLTDIKIFANDREGLNIEILRKLQELDIDIITLNSRKNQNKEVIIDITINIEGIELLNKVIRDIKKIDGIYEVKRRR
jgi:GTP diphosphokinase / guanosine-3',5'-bis(diphosphate) 3'-diphosphatase